MDLQKYFNGDGDGFRRFLVNVISAHTPKEDHWQLETVLLLSKSIFRLIDDIQGDARPLGDAKVLEADFRDVLARLAGGEGLSIRTLTNLLSGIGVPLGGQPGRRPRDYSKEYDWKHSGLSWTEVARKSLVENGEMRTEFGGRDFGSLDLAQQESLKHRIREGVKSYADRTGKLYPIESPSERKQEID